MGFKKSNAHMTFADSALKDSMDKNRCLTRLMDITDTIDRDKIEALLMHNCQVGGSNEGADAYPPLILFKGLLLQKWFHIDSDPELESRINGFILAATLTPAATSDTTFLPWCTAYSRHTKQPLKKVYADKGYAGGPNRRFLAESEFSTA